jgi:hypothetical protein
MYNDKTQILMRDALYAVLQRGDFGLRRADWKKIHTAEQAMEQDRTYASGPMTPKEFMVAIQDIHDNFADKECTHAKMDDLTCKVLATLGYQEGVAIFEAQTKRYA